MAVVQPVVGVVGAGVVDARTPVITADDLGFSRGDGCFDSLRVLIGDDGVARTEGLEAHLARLATSADALGIESPPTYAWSELIEAMLASLHTPGEGTLKLILTRGREWLPQAGPTALVVLTYRGRPNDEAVARARRGVRVTALSSGRPSDAFLDAPWLLGGVKTLSYAINVAAQREARARGADDVLFISTDGYALDGPTSGFLAVLDEALLTTPTEGTGILASTTVQRILAAARADGMPAREELIPVSELSRARGAWLVSSSRGPAPITELDGRQLALDPALTQRIARYAGFA
ncbi:aminodeoxychorismate lyase [Gephyromycinifex aptenodytis]|uniref:aminodeoxychorismate lyase n=1 Tax=Gephyromycinifex aptenodytis TaxID=2716227 RepID=UPI001445CFA8|nr:aminodeoxychorismate lyase [Gephyromycinifex aptenodytis]